MGSGMVIVGAGEAGARAALTLREAGFSGDVTIVGDEPHAPYERPPLSKAAITADDTPSPTFCIDAARMGSQVAHHANAPVVAIDRAEHIVRLTDGRLLPYERLLLATGARPRRLGVPGAEHGCYLRSFEDAVHLRGLFKSGVRIAIIGGGFLGLELAASAVARGAGVTVIEAAPRLLSRGVAEPIATRILERHRRAGVEFHLGTGVERIEAEGDARTVVLSDRTRIVADAVIAGIGAIPDTRLAEAAGLGLDNGIAVNETLATSDPDIFAAGDCCSFPHPIYDGRRIRLEAWRNAQDQGAAAARAMLGSTDAYSVVPWFWSDQYDETLQIAGLPDEGRTTVERDAPLGSKLYFHLADDGRLVAASGVGDNSAIARDIKLAEILVAARAKPNPSMLADPNARLKSLLRS